MDPQTQQGLAMAVIGLAGTAFGLLASTIRDRDKLKYDAKLLALEAQNATQAGQIADLRSTQEECEERHEQCEEQHKTVAQRLDALAAAFAKLGTGSGAQQPLKD